MAQWGSNFEEREFGEYREDELTRKFQVTKLVEVLSEIGNRYERYLDRGGSNKSVKYLLEENKPKNLSL